MGAHRSNAGPWIPRQHTDRRTSQWPFRWGCWCHVNTNAWKNGGENSGVFSGSDKKRHSQVSTQLSNPLTIHPHHYSQVLKWRVWSARICQWNTQKHTGLVGIENLDPFGSDTTGKISQKKYEAKKKGNNYFMECPTHRWTDFLADENIGRIYCCWWSLVWSPTAPPSTIEAEEHSVATFIIILKESATERETNPWMGANKLAPKMGVAKKKPEGSPLNHLAINCNENKTKCTKQQGPATWLECYKRVAPKKGMNESGRP